MVEPTAIRPADRPVDVGSPLQPGMSTKSSTMKAIAAMPLTISASTFLVALCRCIESTTPMPRIAISSTPWAAPK